MLVSLRENGVENDTRFIMPAHCSEYVSAFRPRRGRVAGETSLLFIGRQSLAVPALFLVGPPQDCVSGDTPRIQCQCFVTLIDSIVEPAGKKEHVGHCGCEDG